MLCFAMELYKQLCVALHFKFELPQWLLVEYRGWPDRLGNDTLYVTMDWRGTGEEQALEQEQDKAGKSAFSP